MTKNAAGNDPRKRGESFDRLADQKSQPLWQDVTKAQEQSASCSAGLTHQWGYEGS